MIGSPPCIEHDGSGSINDAVLKLLRELVSSVDIRYLHLINAGIRGVEQDISVLEVHVFFGNEVLELYFLIDLH